MADKKRKDEIASAEPTCDHLRDYLGLPSQRSIEALTQTSGTPIRLTTPPSASSHSAVWSDAASHSCPDLSPQNCRWLEREFHQEFDRVKDMFLDPTIDEIIDQDEKDLNALKELFFINKRPRRG